MKKGTSPGGIWSPLVIVLVVVIVVFLLFTTSGCGKRPNQPSVVPQSIRDIAKHKQETDAMSSEDPTDTKTIRDRNEEPGDLIYKA